MKQFITLLLALAPIIASGQYYTGMGYHDTWKEMKSNDFYKSVEEKEFTNDGERIKIIYGISKSGQTTITAFFKDSKCVFSTLTPSNNDSFNSWVEWFNENCVKVSPMEWTQYTFGTYWEITMKFTDEGTKYFIFE